ncbi:type VII secretion-associated protein [Mycobacterium sp. SMC-4]|uniref:type VII secretion-associated protein n=1 Tax=Mycobacterium sp. SMC-4 TaxID=2857059 RepID=UPI003D073E7C
MTTIVVEVGPKTVRGQGDPPDHWVDAAIDCLDDDIALIDEHPVAVADVWCDVLDAAIGDHPDPSDQIILVLPTWWSATRVATVTQALHRCRADAVVHTRGALLTEDADASVVEVADDFVLLMSGTAEPIVLDRRAMDLTAYLGGVTEVLIDMPTGVVPLPPEVSTDLRAAGVRTTFVGRQRFWRTATDPEPVCAPRQRRRVATAIGVLAASAAAGWAVHTSAVPVDDGSAWVVEGSVGFRVPAQWTVERVTVGPGSARLQVSDPGGTAALHLTQSQLTAPTSRAGLAASLRAAIAVETPGVFVDFEPEGRVGRRPAVTYREIRTHSHTAWAVITDGATSIAVGCQSAPTESAVLHQICVRAVESARVVD